MIYLKQKIKKKIKIELQFLVRKKKKKNKKQLHNQDQFCNSKIQYNRKWRALCSQFIKNLKMATGEQ